MKRGRAKVIAVIPARGGSKGIKLKNIAFLGKKTLVEYAIEHAMHSNLLSRIIVSTDNSKIAKVASRYKKYGIDVYKRPKSLAGDNVSMASVLKNVLYLVKLKEGYVPDIVVTLQPTSPFRKAETIDKAIGLLINKNVDSVIAVCRAEHTPYKMFVLKKGRLKRFVTSGFNANNNRQLYPPVYRESGTLYVTRSRLINKKNRVIGKSPAYIIVDNLQSIDIDEPLDLEIARKLNRRR